MDIFYVLFINEYQILVFGKFMNPIIRIFMSGLLILIPIIFTFSICYWLISWFELTFKNIFLFILPGNYFKEYYFPGLGSIAGILFIFLVGMLMHTWGMKKLYSYSEKLIEKFPIVGDIYSTFKVLLQYFTASENKQDDQVVILDYQGIKVLGIVTRENFENFPDGIGGEDIIAVYLPMSYQLGGYTLYLHKKYVTPINMTKKEALQFILTAGLGNK